MDEWEVSHFSMHPIYVAAHQNIQRHTTSMQVACNILV